MRGELAGGHHGVVGNYLIRSTVLANADDGTILHRTPSKVTHTLSRSLGIEVFPLQIGQYLAYLLGRSNGRHGANLFINKLCHVDGNITSVSLCPSFLPQVTCHLGNLFHYSRQPWTAVQYTLHIIYIHYLLYKTSPASSEERERFFS